ncbi:Pectinesterase inhibitor [Melia azedarach]|uniref:Pectinesterase inhibitor n=1 Tax=Melia azedarach TaxID=155640 RepID=A0ACC1YZ72_MELAZ|nr:Pectinesterase inhibitor [Melia azedarach]
MKQYSLSTFTCLITFFLLCDLHPVSPSFIDDSCREAATGDPTLNYKLCVSSLESNPRSQNASSHAELTIISIGLTISNATNMSSYITRLISTSESFDKHTKNCLQDCLELYSDAGSTLQDAMNDFKSGDIVGAIVKISSAMDGSLTCEDGFKEKKDGVSPLSKENRSFFQLTAISLTFIHMLFH